MLRHGVGLPTVSGFAANPSKSRAVRGSARVDEINAPFRPAWYGD
jgi:hypothetical protein